MQQRSGHSKAAPWTTITVLVVAVAMLVATAQFSSGAAAGHATSHLMFGLVPALLAIVAQWLWRPRPSPQEHSARTMFITASFVLAATQLLEGIGAFGDGPAGSGVRSELLRTLHNAASGVSFFALAFFAGTLVVVPVALVTRLLRSRRGRAFPP
jgi:hypothetical protein